MHILPFATPFLRRIRRIVGLSLVAGALASIGIAGVTTTLTPTTPLIGGGSSRPAFTILLVGDLSYDANGNEARDIIDSYTVSISTYGSVWNSAPGCDTFTTTFTDPRSSAGVGIHLYSVGGTGYHAAPYNYGWQNGYDEEEHNNPDDPDEVTGSHWVDGSYDAGFDWSLMAFGGPTIQFDLRAGTAQTISFPNPGNSSLNAVFSLSATASSGLPVSYSLVGGGGSLSGSTFSATARGNTTIRASRADGTNANIYYLAAAPVDQTFSVTGISQSISGFPTIPAHTFLDAPFAISATASSGLPVTFSVLAGPATISGNTATLTGAGNVTVSANQVGNSTYEPTTLSQTFVVAQANQTITFPAISPKIHGNPPFYPGATASSGLAISYSVLSGPATIDYSGRVVTTGVGNVTVQAAQPGSINYHPAGQNPTQTFSVSSAFTVTPTSSGATPPVFLINFNAGRVIERASLTVYDQATGENLGCFYATSSNTWGNWELTPYYFVAFAATWTDSRGLAFNGTHSYEFRIRTWSNEVPTAPRGDYGPVTASGTITGGPNGSIDVVPGNSNAYGGPANFTITINNNGYGSGVTSWMITDLTDTGGSGGWGYPTGAITDSYTLTWTDPRAPVPVGPREFAITAYGTRSGVQYCFRTTASYHETPLVLQIVAPNVGVSVQPRFNVLVGENPPGLTYLKIESEGNTWYLSSNGSPSVNPSLLYPATSYAQQFGDPRGGLGYENHAYSVTVYERGYVIGPVWIDGYWEDEHNDPYDPELVTGSRWVDGTWETGYVPSDWAVYAQQSITTPAATPPDTTPPTVPTSLVASSLTSTSFLLSWTAATDAIGVTAYEVRRNGLSLGNTLTLSSASTGLLAGVTYTMEVRARDAAGNWSGWASLSVPTVPPTVSGEVLTAPAVGPYSATLIWNNTADSASVVGYKVYRILGQNVPVLVGATSNLSIADTGLTPATSYTYTLWRISPLGTESPSPATVALTTAAPTTGHSDADGFPDNVEVALATAVGSVATRDDPVENLVKSNVHRPNP